MKPPKVSIIVPCFNAAATLERTLVSLRDQAYPDLEVIVMDGASTDGTQAIIEAHADVVSAYVSETDAGQADALNKGFDRASGELFGWLCADDVLLPGALSMLAGALVEAPEYGLVTAGCRRKFDFGDVETHPRPDFQDALRRLNTIEQPSTLWRAEAHRQAGRLRTDLKYAFDWEWWLRLSRTGCRFTAIDAVVSEYLFSGENLTSTGGDALARDMYEVLKAHGTHGGRVADLYWFLYSVFDKRGFYDTPNAADKPGYQRAGFHLLLRGLQVIFGRETVDSYNWNFASRQARGLDWAEAA